MKYILFCLIIPFINGAPPPPTTNPPLIDDIITSVDKILHFFSEDYSDINVDGLFGLRLGQGQLIQAVQDCKVNPRCTDQIYSKLHSLEKTLSDTCDKALPYVKSYDEDYFQRFKDTIDKPYLLPYQPTTFTKKDLILSGGKNSSYNEDKGDAYCFRNVGWYTQVEKFNNGEKILDIQKRFCRASDLASSGNVRITNRDLFLEQTVLCGTLGFEDFMRKDWIKMAVKWQDKKDGCFKMSLSRADDAADKLIKTIAGMEGITDPKVIQQYEKQAEAK
ncbi:hypothetical protein KUTeg_010057, partial [Tegillarca granosa]